MVDSWSQKQLTTEHDWITSSSSLDNARLAVSSMQDGRAATVHQ